MKRGEIWVGADRLDYARKPRPVIIVQNDDYPYTESVIVCPITGEESPFPTIRPLISPTPENGLRDVSWAMVDKLMGMRRSGVRQRVGILEAATLEQIESVMTAILGLAR